MLVIIKVQKELYVKLLVHDRIFRSYKMREFRGFPGASGVKHLPVMQERQIQSLGCKDPLEKEMAIHSSFLVWEVPWTEEPSGL